VRLPAAKGASQIVSLGVAWMGQEQDAAMPAALQAWLQLGLRPDSRAQQECVDPDQVADLPLSPPARRKLEMLLDSYCKKARLSLMIEIVLYMPSFYPIGKSLSTGKTRVFF